MKIFLNTNQFSRKTSEQTRLLKNVATSDKILLTMTICEDMLVVVYYCLYITQFQDVIGFINIHYENRISDFLFTHNMNDN